MWKKLFRERYSVRYLSKRRPGLKIGHPNWKFINDKLVNPETYTFDRFLTRTAGSCPQSPLSGQIKLCIENRHRHLFGRLVT